MPTFETSEPVQITVEAVIGDIRVTASDRSDAVVEVRPRRDSSPSDVRAAEQVHVELVEGRLAIRAAKPWRHYTPFGGSGSVEVVLEVPTGSSLTGESLMGGFHAEGELGPCRFKTAMGDLRVDHVGPCRLRTSHGAVVVDRVAGDAELAGSGEIRIGGIDGAAVVKNANGDTAIGSVTGDLRVKSANGDIAVGRAGRSVVARTACGDIRIGEVTTGVVELKTAAGEVDVGVARGTAAWIDAASHHGHVHHALDAVEGPEPTDETVEVRIRTSHGDIAIRRSGGAAGAQQTDRQATETEART